MNFSHFCTVLLKDQLSNCVWLSDNNSYGEDIKEKRWPEIERYT